MFWVLVSAKKVIYLYSHRIGNETTRKPEVRFYISSYLNRVKHSSIFSAEIYYGAFHSCVDYPLEAHPHPCNSKTARLEP
jgi:hypothetical protein